MRHMPSRSGIQAHTIPTPSEPALPKSRARIVLEWVVASWIISICVVITALPFWCMLAPAISSSSMDELHKGMTEDEVIDLLGEANSVHEWGDGEEWCYHRNTWAMMFLRFDKQGRLVSWEHDY